MSWHSLEKLDLLEIICWVLNKFTNGSVGTFRRKKRSTKVLLFYRWVVNQRNGNSASNHVNFLDKLSKNKFLEFCIDLTDYSYFCFPRALLPLY